MFKTLLVSAFALAANICCLGAVFSGPQPGEKTTSFQVQNLAGENQKRDPIAENAGAPTALVFVHAMERSLVPLLREVDRYGYENKERLKTEIIFLSGDKLAGEQRARAAINSLRLQSRVGLSVDGIEGPGNYGLNKECMLTIIASRDNKVAAAFALTQPGIADASKVLEALANICGDPHPPTADQINARQAERGQMRPRANAADGNDPLPGAAPTDQKLVSMLRRFIQPANDDAAVDKAIADVEAYVKGDADLTKQAINGWVRVLHLKYGTSYAHKAGQEFVDRLRKNTETK